MAGRPVRGLTIILIYYFYHMQCMLNAYNITILLNMYFISSGIMPSNNAYGMESQKVEVIF